MSRPHAQPVAASTIDQAAAWLVRLHAGDLDRAGQEALNRWRRERPEHEKAWQAAESLAGTLRTIPPAIGMRALASRRQAQRRRVVKALALLLAAPATGWLGWQHSQAPFDAGLRTATGERREIRLADGSRLFLNSATVADIEFTADRRQIVLHAGEILVETAPDTVRPARPFVVATRHGLIRALGTRFTVRRDGSRSQVGVLEHAVEIRPFADLPARRLDAGQWTAFDTASYGQVSPLAPGSDAWVRGNLIADRQRLQDFLAELERHRPGRLRCAPEVADLRISGVFQLDDSDRILAILEENLPIRISRHSRYWVNVHARDTPR